MIYPTPDYLFRCFEHGKTLSQAEGRLGDINLSGIATRIIQDTGRFAESYASDMLVSWNQVVALTEPHEVIPDEESIIIFAIRRNGVDHTAYLMHRLQDTIEGFYDYVYPGRIYRRILAVKVITPFGQKLGWDQKPQCTVILRDITDHMLPMPQADRDWNPDAWEQEYIKQHPGYQP